MAWTNSGGGSWWRGTAGVELQTGAGRIWGERAATEHRGGAAGNEQRRSTGTEQRGGQLVWRRGRLAMGTLANHLDGRVDNARRKTFGCEAGFSFPHGGSFVVIKSNDMSRTGCPLGGRARKLGKHRNRCFFRYEGNPGASVEAKRTTHPFGSFGSLFFVESM